VVTEPVIPTVCKTLTATRTASNRAFSSSDEANAPDTSRIQSALNGCAGTGKAVELTASAGNNAFLSGPLTIGKGVTLLINAGTTLYGSRNPAAYQVSGKPACGTIASAEGGCAPLISVTGAGSAIEGVRGSTGSQGTIDGRGDQTIFGKSTTWWGLATAAKSGGNQENPRMVQAVHADDFTLYDINLVNSPNFHVSYQNGNGFTAWGVRIKTPANARNTDGIDPAGATNVTINDSYIQDGDDGIAIKGASASSNITVENSHFYGTHGMSIGSETNSGVTNVLFVGNTVSGSDSSGIASTSDNGIRIKSDSSRGGKVSRIGYLNNCLSGVRNLMVFDTHYSSSTGSLIPYFTGIVVDGLKSVNSVSGGTSVLSGYSSAYPLGLTLENVSLDAVSNSAQYAAVSTYGTNLHVAGAGVSVTTLGSAPGSVPSCGFPTFPAL
jgi:polygalacturonase